MPEITMQTILAMRTAAVNSIQEVIKMQGIAIDISEMSLFAEDADENSNGDMIYNLCLRNESHCCLCSVDGNKHYVSIY